MKAVDCVKCGSTFDASVMPTVLKDTCPWCLGWRTPEDYDRAYAESQKKDAR